MPETLSQVCVSCAQSLPLERFTYSKVSARHQDICKHCKSRQKYMKLYLEGKLRYPFSVRYVGFCDHCGKQRISQRKTGRFCSRDCKDANRREVAKRERRSALGECVVCGKHHDRVRSKTCSPLCSQRRRQALDPDRFSKYYAKAKLKTFGLTTDDYEQMLDKQGGVCAICGETESRAVWQTGQTRMLAVDHCHKTGAVRGLLCSACNQAIGLLQDDPRRMMSAAAYITEHVTK